jgi:hypothetical protein
MSRSCSLNLVLFHLRVNSNASPLHVNIGIFSNDVHLCHDQYMCGLSGMTSTGDPSHVRLPANVVLWGPLA